MSTGSNKLHDCFLKIGKNISHYRKKKGMTLEELGISIGTDKSAVYHIEQGKPITVKTLLKISAQLEVPVSKLVQNLPELKPSDIDSWL